MEKLNHALLKFKVDPSQQVDDMSGISGISDIAFTVGHMRDGKKINHFIEGEILDAYEENGSLIVAITKPNMWEFEINAITGSTSGYVIVPIDDEERSIAAAIELLEVTDLQSDYDVIYDPSTMREIARVAV